MINSGGGEAGWSDVRLKGIGAGGKDLHLKQNDTCLEMERSTYRPRDYGGRGFLIEVSECECVQSLSGEQA